MWVCIWALTLSSFRLRLSRSCRILWRQCARRESRAGCCEVAWRSSLDLSMAFVQPPLDESSKDQFQPQAIVTIAEWTSWCLFLAKVVTPSHHWWSDPSEGQTAVVASAESLKQTCHRFYLRFHTFIHIDRIDVLNFVNVLQQILQDSKKVTGNYRRVPLVWKEDCEERVFWWLSKERISRLWNPSPTALFRPFRNRSKALLRPAGVAGLQIHFFMFGHTFSYIFHSSIHVCAVLT